MERVLLEAEGLTVLMVDFITTSLSESRHLIYPRPSYDERCTMDTETKKHTNKPSKYHCLGNLRQDSVIV